MTGDIRSGLLRDFGWSEEREALFAPTAAEGLVPARVVSQLKGHYTIVTDQGEQRAEVAGKIHFTAKGPADFPAVGDWVAMAPQAEPGVGTIRAILPRRSEFSRNVAGLKKEKQVLAANIDVVFLMSALDENYNPRRIERLLAMAAGSGARPVIVLNKMDLCSEPNEFEEEIHSLAGTTPVCLMSAKQSLGIEAIECHLGQRLTGALLGSSGVGKSTLINRLLGQERQRTIEVREVDGKGRHATTVRELILLPSGRLLIDTPGLREAQLWDESTDVEETFEEIDALSAECRFRDCKHQSEPGCAVLRAVDEGTIPEERLESFRKLQRELDHHQRKSDKTASLKEKKKATRLSTGLRRGYRQ